MKKDLLFSLVILCGLTFSYGQRSAPASNAASTIHFSATLLQTAKLSGGCDTVGNFDLVNMTPTVYTSQGWGYVAGHNAYGDLAKAEMFPAPALPSTVNGTVIIFSAAHAGNPTSTIDVKVWDGSTGSPGTELGSMSVLINTLSTTAPTVLMFPTPIVVTDAYFIGFTLDYNTPQDTIAVITSADAEGPNTGWEQWDTGVWYEYGDASSWNLDLTSAIWSVECVITGVNEGISASSIALYPNPATDKINLVLPSDYKGSVEVIDITGKTVLNSECNSSYSLDISSLTKGVYTLKFSARESIIHKMFVKE